jgi:hypothetical protein
MVEAKLLKLRTEMELLKRPKPRRENADPNSACRMTDMPAPHRVARNIDIELPSLPKPFTESVEPSRAKARHEMAEPKAV